MNPSRYSVYIIACTGGRLYIGHTNDMRRRLRAHEDGTAAAFTSEHRPLKLMHLEHYETRAIAMNRERQLKGWTRAKKEALINGDRKQLRQLSRRRADNSVPLRADRARHKPTRREA